MKAKYYISKFQGKDEVEAKQVEGYLVELPIGGKNYLFGVHKDPESHPANLWAVTELGTGYTTAPTKYETRKEAIGYITSAKHVESFGEYVAKKAAMYEAQCKMLDKLVADGKPMKRKKHVELLKKWESEIAAANFKANVENIAKAAGEEVPEKVAKAVEKAAKKKAGAEVKATAKDLGDGVTAVVVEPKRPAKPRKKPEPPKTEVKITTARITPTEGGYKAEPIAEKTVVVEDGKVVETAAAVTIESMREWVKGKDGLRIEQAGKNPANPIWVCGPSKQYREELMAMGFKWGTSKKFGKGWHYEVK